MLFVNVNGRFRSLGPKSQDPKFLAERPRGNKVRVRVRVRLGLGGLVRVRVRALTEGPRNLGSWDIGSKLRKSTIAQFADNDVIIYNCT